MKNDFLLNGEKISIEHIPGELLVDMLRSRLGLTGTKLACGEGECGACTILLDGEPVNSCMILASQVSGHEVFTIEGMKNPDGTLHPLQQAFLDTGAVQCGYCTPGMVLAAKALLDKCENPDRETIAQALAGNICRCTGYIKIIDAVILAAQRMRDKSKSEGA